MILFDINFSEKPDETVSQKETDLVITDDLTELAEKVQMIALNLKKIETMLEQQHQIREQIQKDYLFHKKAFSLIVKSCDSIEMKFILPTIATIFHPKLDKEIYVEEDEQ